MPTDNIGSGIVGCHLEMDDGAEESVGGDSGYSDACFVTPEPVVPNAPTPTVMKPNHISSLPSLQPATHFQCQHGIEDSPLAFSNLPNQPPAPATGSLNKILEVSTEIIDLTRDITECLLIQDKNTRVTETDMKVVMHEDSKTKIRMCPFEDAEQFAKKLRTEHLAIAGPVQSRAPTACLSRSI